VSRAATPAALAALRQAFAETLGAERRLRSRDRPSADGLTYAQLRALTCLHDKDEATAGELARFADVNPATMTAMLDQLESADIVRRERRADDRRVVVVSLTDEGRRIVHERHRQWDDEWRACLAGLSDEELEAATRVLRRLTETLDAAARQPDGER
jgi:DNA-binding MarR family transcriptional regulator